MKLYELTDALRRVLDLADDEAFDTETGEYTSPTEETTAILDTLDMAFDAKIEGIAKVIRTLEAQADAARKESDRLAARSKHFAGRAKWLKDYARQAIDAVDPDKKIKTPLFTLWVQDASSRPLHIAEDAQVPEEFLKPPKPREVDKNALKKALKDGREFAGIVLGAASRSFRIK